MNKFVNTALALAAAGSLAHAGTGDGDWLELDREIASLSTPVASSAQGGMNWSALIRNTLTNSDESYFLTGAADTMGFGFTDVDVAASGSVGDFGWRVSGDVGGGAWATEDAYVTWQCGDMFGALLGSHKASTLASSNVSPGNMLFNSRSVLGSSFDNWDNGVRLDGSFEGMMSWCLSIQNGSDTTGDDHVMTARFEYDLGEGAGDAQGASGAGDDLAATLGVTLYDDGVLSDGDMTAVDINGTAGAIGFGVELAEVGDGLTLATDEDYAGAGLAIGADSSPMAVTVSYLVNEEWEVGLRSEDLDDAAETTVLSLGVNWYQSGHNAKWNFGYMDVDTDAGGAGTGSAWTIGVTVGSSS